jgi:hypothetical protein
VVRIGKADPDRGVVWLDGDVSAQRGEAHLKLRLWDQDGGALPVGAGPAELDPGVRVEFAGGPFRTGDYWVFPARPSSATVEWPSAPPRGIRHDYCKLAVVEWRELAAGGWEGSVTDCRRLFAPAC